MVILTSKNENDWYTHISHRVKELSGSSYRKFSEKKRKQTYKSTKVKNVKKSSQSDITADLHKTAPPAVPEPAKRGKTTRQTDRRRFL